MADRAAHVIALSLGSRLHRVKLFRMLYVQNAPTLISCPPMVTCVQCGLCKGLDKTKCHPWCRRIPKPKYICGVLRAKRAEVVAKGDEGFLLQERRSTMPSYVYVAAQDDNQISVLTIDDQTGRLKPQTELPMPGGPSLLAISPNRQDLYVGHREVPEISSHRIDPSTGGITRTGSISPPDAPGFIATDRSGRYLLAAYYQGGRAAVHPIGDDGAIAAPPD